MNCYDSSQPVDEELMTSGVVLGRDGAVQIVIVIIAHNQLTTLPHLQPTEVYAARSPNSHVM